MEATLRVTPEELINRDVNALQQVLGAIDTVIELLGETKEAITGEENDHIISYTIMQLNETRQQIEGMIDYCRSLEEVCVPHMNIVYASPDIPPDAVYAPPDVMAVISRDDSILDGAKADDTKEKDFDPDETLQFCNYCGAAAPMSAKVCKKCGRKFAIWKQKSASDVMEEKRETSTSTDRPKK